MMFEFINGMGPFEDKSHPEAALSQIPFMRPQVVDPFSLQVFYVLGVENRDCRCRCTGSFNDIHYPKEIPTVEKYTKDKTHSLNIKLILKDTNFSQLISSFKELWPDLHQGNKISKREKENFNL